MKGGDNLDGNTASRCLLFVVFFIVFVVVAFFFFVLKELDLCRSWMGTVNMKGVKRLPPVPVALNELEIEKFGLESLEDEEVIEDEQEVILDTAEAEAEKENEMEQALKVYQGLKVEDVSLDII